MQHCRALDAGYGGIEDDLMISKNCVRHRQIYSYNTGGRNSPRLRYI